VKHIVLIGFMAAGKSTVGASLARRLRRPFIDTDAWIERERGSIPRIFSREGERAFRKYELAAVAAALKSKEASVVAVGGGAPTHAATRRLLARAYRVFLEVAPATAARRVQRAKSLRPVAGHAPSRAAIEALYRERMPLYRDADATVACDGRSVASVAAAVHALARDAGIVP
jgi:shikimate kinase